MVVVAALLLVGGGKAAASILAASDGCVILYEVVRFCRKICSRTNESVDVCVACIRIVWMVARNGWCALAPTVDSTAEPSVVLHTYSMYLTHQAQ